jgi:hypothetical protein
MSSAKPILFQFRCICSSVLAECISQTDHCILGSRFKTLHDFGFVALDISYTIPEDGGVYTCRAVNPIGSSESSGTLIIQRTFNAVYFDRADNWALQRKSKR